MAQNQISPAQRAALFAQTTRQNLQMLPAIAGAASSTVTFNIPKVRLSSRIRLMVQATLTATHAANTSYTPNAFAPFTLIRKAAVDMNNGFAPFNLSGKQLYMYSMMRDNAAILGRASSGRGKVVQPVVASNGGTANQIQFVADLPLSLNDRDPVGLVVTQNQETTVTVTVDIDAAAVLADATAGYTYALSNIVITPMVESFSVPATPDAFPDISVLKLVQATKQSISGAGQFTVALPVGTTYRKLAFFVEDANGLGVADSALTGNIELVFNQADTPYRISPAILAAMNHEQFGYVLPQGMYAFDFSYQGISNYGGARDYIDTERLTEFWLRFGAASAGAVTVVYETLSRLRSN